MIKVGISGANGRMGQAIESVITSRDQKFELVAKLTSTSTKEAVENACKLSDVIIDFAKCRVLDSSGIEAIDALADRFQRKGTQLHLRHLSADCQKLLNKASRYVEADDNNDPDYGVAVDYSRMKVV